jgi:hypothetical protein
MAQAVNRLPRKCEALRSNPSITTKKERKGRREGGCGDSGGCSNESASIVAELCQMAAY